MSKLYIANCTQQVQDFQYRKLETTIRPTPVSQMIPIGGQIMIPGDLSTPEIDFIIEPQVPYGMVRVDEIDRTRPFIGLCYSVDKKIDVNKVRTAVLHNTEVLVERGKQIREEAAVAVNNAVAEQTPGVDALKALEMSVVEVEQKGEDIKVNETVRVDRSAPQARTVSTRGRSRAGAG